MTATIGIAGITSKFARLLTVHLLRNPSVQIRGYSRDLSKLPLSITSSSRIQLIQGDAFDLSKIHSFVKSCNVVICCYRSDYYLGDDNLMLDGQKNLIDACETEGVPKYIASDWTFDYTKIGLGEIPLKDAMILVKSYLETKDHVKGVHILTGPFIEAMLHPILGIWDSAAVKFRYWGNGDEVLEGTTYEDAAAFTAAIALDESAVGVKRVLGGASSITQIAASYEKVYGIKPELESLGSLETLHQRVQELAAETPQNPGVYTPLLYQYYIMSGKTLVGPDLDNTTYPTVKAQNWEDFLRLHPKEYLDRSYESAAKAV
ncbi:hypothetical protein HYFRA_00000474 [Hymenoscyphus fraxineus]|uniref:NAD(P)-binding domain-containing protein n=1 Tax=Hymenoscyphus fraxineus TaxID=746836 RepID=A0A9N9L4R3_9HELO|nr:hypothetical protein HYFRA_00000474 [Hymenoscyphus fraxineus]